jgi:uncharacterized membrane protein YvbJ
MKRSIQKKSEDWFVCPHCGAQVSTKASACPQCGSDETTGWSDEADKWAADIPTGYSQEEFENNEFNKQQSLQKDKTLGMSPRLFAILIAVLILAIFLLFVLF